LLGFIEAKSNELLTYKKRNSINYQRGDFVPRKPRIKSESGIYPHNHEENKLANFV